MLIEHGRSVQRSTRGPRWHPMRRCAATSRLGLACASCTAPASSVRPVRHPDRARRDYHGKRRDSGEYQGSIGDHCLRAERPCHRRDPGGTRCSWPPV